ncbi:MAG: NAD(P)/FAD-dependent oxidoreductase [Asgard group archaeon]|nr:NAD(P)/FAD-dependent oxidoreductase [Asgard group archaeon]
MLISTNIVGVLMLQDMDVVIIGAGPAGLQAARCLAENDIDYLLLSREKKPGEKKACGGFVTQAALEEFDIKRVLGSHSIRSIRMRFKDTKIKQVDFEEPVGVNVTRTDLGITLLSLVENSSEHIQMETEVGKITVTSKKCVISFRYSQGIGEVESNLVIDASGVSPVSLKTNQIRERMPPQSLGYTYQYQMRKPSSQSQFENINDFYYGSDISPRGYAWVYPRGHEAAVGTGGLLSKVKESDKRLPEFLDYLVNNIEPAKSDLSTSEIYKREAALVPLGGITRPSFSNRLMLAGDAAGHCSPISGEGIHYSMIGGYLAALVALESIKRKDYSSQFLRKYEKLWIKRMGSDLKWGIFLQKRFMDKGSTGLGSKFIESEKSCRIIAEMLVGKRSVKGAIMAAIPGYLLSKIR